jgi:hypothetical protein
MRGETHNPQDFPESAALASHSARTRRRAAPGPQPGGRLSERRDRHRSAAPKQRGAQSQRDHPDQVASPGGERAPGGEAGHGSSSAGAEAVRARSGSSIRTGFTQTLAIGIGMVLLFSYIGWICMEMGYRVHMGDETLEAIAGAMFLAALAAVLGARSRR